MNLPQSDEIAILLPGDGSEVHDDFDVIIQSHRGRLQRVHMLNGSFEPLHFPLLFPYGELGFMNGMPLRKRPQLPNASEHDEPVHTSPATSMSSPTATTPIHEAEAACKLSNLQQQHLQVKAGECDVEFSLDSATESDAESSPDAVDMPPEPHEHAETSGIAAHTDMSRMQYAAYMLQKRANAFNVLHHANRLAQEWMVQTYGVMELQRLIWHWTHQDAIRADLYQART